MSETNFISSVWDFDSNGVASPVEVNEEFLKKPLTNMSGFRWIHLNFSHDNAKELLSHIVSSPTALQNLTAENTRPRFESFGRQSFLIILRGVNLITADRPHDMISLRCWVQDNCIITLGRRSLKSLSDVIQSLQNEQSQYKTPICLLLAINQRLIDRMAEPLSNLEDKIDQLEEDEINEHIIVEKHDIATIRSQALTLRRYLVPQKEALIQFLNDDELIENEAQTQKLRYSLDHLQRYVEDLDLGRERLNSLNQEIDARLSEKMNRNLYILSIISLIFLPLAFLTGLLGINVGGIPLADSDLGFTIICTICGIIAILEIIILRHLRWIDRR